MRVGRDVLEVWRDFTIWRRGQERMAGELLSCFVMCEKEGLGCVVMHTAAKKVCVYHFCELRYDLCGGDRVCAHAVRTAADIVCVYLVCT